MTTLVFDRRAELQGRPATHALVIGVSEYANLPPAGSRLGIAAPHFGLTRLGSPALSAHRIRAWLEAHADTLPAPLATLRFLALPSPEELAVEPALAGAAVPKLAAVQQAASDWRDDAAKDPDGVTVCFFSGHGVQVDRLENILLLADFGSGLGSPLQDGVNVSSLVNGMAATPGRPDIARRQLYFFDACRTPLALIGEDEHTASLALSVQVPSAERRAAIRYYAAAPGTEAFGIVGEPTLYTGALLRCLEGAASDRTSEGWVVTAGSLAEGVDELLADAAALEGGEQRSWTEGNLANADLVVVPVAGDPPPTELELSVAPAEYSDRVSVHLKCVLTGTQHDPPAPLHPHPYTCTLAPNYYFLGAHGTPPAHGCADDVVLVRGARMRRKLRVA